MPPSMSSTRIEMKEWSSFRLHVKLVLECQPFELALSAIIVFNLVLMVVETDITALGGAIPGWLQTLNNALLVTFVLELCCRLYVYRFKFFMDIMSIIDLCVVGLDIMSILLEVLFDGLGGLSILRILRLMRLSRATLIVEKVPELSMLARSLLGALKPIFWGSIILVFLLGAWGVLAVQFIHPLNEKLTEQGLYTDCERCPRAYKTVWMSALTMVQQIIAGDSWGAVTLPVVEHYPSAGIFFILMFISLQVALMNVVLACVVDSAAQARVDDLSGNTVQKKLRILCEELDNDDSGEITFNELKAGFANNKEFKRRMTQMDIHEHEIDVVWELLDADQSGTLDVAEFVDELAKLKKANAHTMLLMIRHYVSDIRDKVEETARMMRNEVDAAEKRERALAESVQKEEEELLASAARIEDANAAALNRNFQQGSSSDKNTLKSGAGCIGDALEEKMNDRESTGIAGWDTAFMEEQREFMNELLESSKEIKRKLETCMNFNQLPSASPPLPLALDYRYQGSSLDQMAGHDIRPLARERTPNDMPNTRPGLPVALCPTSMCSKMERANEAVASIPVRPNVPPFATPVPPQR